VHKHKLSHMKYHLYTAGSVTTPSCIRLRPHVIQNLVIKIAEVTKEREHITFIVVSEIPQYLTRASEISRYTKHLYPLINRFVVNSRYWNTRNNRIDSTRIWKIIPCRLSPAVLQAHNYFPFM